MRVRCYLLNAQVNAVQGLVQRRSYALGGGDGALWTLLLHICEETLCVGSFLVSFAVLCGNVQAELLPAQDALHSSSLLGKRVRLCSRRARLFPSQRGVLKFHCIARILRFAQNNLSVLHHKEPLWRQMRWVSLILNTHCDVQLNEMYFVHDKK